MKSPVYCIKHSAPLYNTASPYRYTNTLLLNPSGVRSNKPHKQLSIFNHIQVRPLPSKKTLYMFSESKSITVTAGIIWNKPKIAYWSKYKLNQPKGSRLRYIKVLASFELEPKHGPAYSRCPYLKKLFNLALFYILLCILLCSATPLFAMLVLIYPTDLAYIEFVEPSANTILHH